jgi:hypothetical protein
MTHSTTDDWMREGYDRGRESMREMASEQTVIYPEAHPDGVPPILPFSDTDRARALLSVLRRARQFVGEGGGADLPSELDFMLRTARQANLPASLYATIWELRGFCRGHISIANEVPLEK